MNVLLCPFSDAGYLYPALAVGRRLRHAVFPLVRPGAAGVVGEAGFAALDAHEYGGARAFSVAWWGETGAAQYRAVVRAAREVRADALVTSILCHGALLAAEALDLPVVVLGFAAHLWTYGRGGEGERHGRAAMREQRLLELLRRYELARERAGLPPRRDRRRDLPLIGSGLLLRGDPALEHPGAELPEGVRHVGPCPWEPAADPAALHWLTARVRRIGKPVVYVHLGRVFGGESMWPRLNTTFTGGPFQAVVERGRSGEPRPAPVADVVVVREPWMGPLIELSDLVLTNGTSSPVLAALMREKPLAVAPIGSEQPLLSEACVRAGVAVGFPPGPGPAGDGVAALGTAYAGGLGERVRALGARLNASGGAAAAADAVVAAASSERAVAPGAAHTGAGPPGAASGAASSGAVPTGVASTVPVPVRGGAWTPALDAPVDVGTGRGGP
ncbi:glycosyltransferase [Microbispora sp. H10670]|uniref:glycosyltransferase n=1 Tax=Microbispora sp. H10670 TaxID=2729108 RepID=UPI001604237C|nr:glycosyltransferase [Microbispora sp. H10670]